MKKIFIYILLISPICFFGQSFFKSYGGPGNDFGESILSTSDGSFIAVGATESFGNGATDLYAFKIDSNGEYLWSKSFGGPNIDYGTDLIQLSDGSILFTGYSNSFSTGYDIFLVKTNSNGAHQWTKNFGGIDWDFCYAAYETKHSSSGVVLVGKTYSYGNGNADAYLAKIDLLGDTLWTKTFGGVENDCFNDVIEDGFGNLICIGTTRSGTTFSDNDLWIIKTDSDGNELWNYTWSDTLDQEGISLCMAKNGNYYFAGNDQEIDRISPYYACLDPSGNLVFSKNFAGTLNDYSAEIIRHHDSTSYTYVGNCFSFGASNLTADVLYSQIIGTYTIGPLLGTSGTFENEWVNGADTTADHAIVIIGTTDGTLNGQNSAFIMKKDENYFSPAYTEEIDLAVDENSANFLSLYPNPVLKNVYISSNNQIKEIMVFNTLGELVLKKQNHGNILDLSELRSGIYFLKTSTNVKSLSFIKL